MRTVTKVVYVFTRKPGMDRAAFFDHYLNVHAPLAVRHHRNLSGYIVNLADVGEPNSGSHLGDSAIDAVTVNWGRKGKQSFDSVEEQALLVDDHHSFIGERRAYHVRET